MLGLTAGDAAQRATVYTTRWNYPNTYCLGKHLAEQMVAQYQQRYALPVAVVRPALVSAVAKAPYPGYAGNWAGPLGAQAAMATGLFDSLASVASQPVNVWDVVPGDCAAAAIVAAAAAVAAGVSVDIAAQTGSGLVIGDKGDRRPVFGAQSAVAQPATLQQKYSFKQIPSHRSDDTAMSQKSSTCLGSDTASDSSTAASPQLSPAARTTNDQTLTQRLLMTAAAADRIPPLLIVHAATSTTYPLTLMEGWNYNVEFMAAHPPRFTITVGTLPRMTPEFQPSLSRVDARTRWTGWKVWALASVLR